MIRAIAAIAAMYSVLVFASDQECLREQFEEVQKTIAANCAECYGASKEVFLRAVVSLEELIAAGLSDPAAKIRLAESYQTWAFAYSEESTEKSEELQRKARSIYRDLIEQFPDDSNLWYLYGRSLEDPSAAIEALERAESLSPDNPSIQYSLGMFYAHGLGQTKEGAAHLERAVQLEQNYPKLRYLEQLARVYEQMGDMSRAAMVRDDMKAFQLEFEKRKQ